MCHHPLRTNVPNETRAMTNYPVNYLPQPAPMPVKPPSQIAQINLIINQITSNFSILKNSYGTIFFAHNVTHSFYFIDDPRVYDNIKSFLFSFNLKINDSHIKHAISIIKSNQIFLSDFFCVRANKYFEKIYFVFKEFVFLSIDKSGFISVLNSNNPEMFNLPFYFVKNDAIRPCPYNIDIDLLTTHYYPPNNNHAKNIRDKLLSRNNTSPLFNLFKHIGVPVNCNILILTWIVQALMPEQYENFVALEITGESGSGKTTLQKMIHILIDLNAEFFSPLPKNKKELGEILLNEYITSFDNVSEIKDAVQDELAKLLVGGSFDLPKLSKQNPRTLFLKKPLMLNAITPVINHPELSKFTITIELQPQTTVRVNDFCIERLFNESLFNLFNDAFIEILCLTALTFSRLNNQENVSELQQHNPVGPLKRFCKIGIIVAEELGLTSDVFWNQFNQQQQNRLAALAEKNPIIEAILKLFEQDPRTDMTCSPQEWMNHLEPFKASLQSDKHWPHNAKQMGVYLKQAVPILRQHDILCESLGKRGSVYLWNIKMNLA